MLVKIIEILGIIFFTIKKALGPYLIYLFSFMAILPLFRLDIPENYLKDEEKSKMPISNKERVKSLETIEDAEYWRFKALSQAEEKIDMAVYSFRSDKAGLSFASLLLDKADEGVKVRLLFDGTNIKIVNEEFFSLIDNHPNIEVKIYNPVNLLKPWKLNYRLHDKFIIVDDEIYILGGRNQNSLFIGDYDDETRKNKDRDLLVYQGDKKNFNSLNQLEEYFEELWDLGEVKKVKNLNEKEKYENFRNKLDEINKSLKEKMPDAFEPTNWEEETFSAEHIELIRGPVKAENKPPIIYKNILNKMREGKKVIIETPYIILNRDHYKDFSILKEQYGVDLIIMTNSPEYGANFFGKVEQVFNRRSILNTGAKVYEYMGKKPQHTKTILIDDNISIVGSFNYDMRSIYLNTEAMLYVESKELNAQLTEMVKEKKESSRQVFIDGEMEYGPLAREGKLTRFERNFLRLAYLISYPIRHLF